MTDLVLFSVLFCRDAEISVVSEETSYFGKFVAAVINELNGQIQVAIELVETCSRVESWSINTVLRVKCPELCGKLMKPKRGSSFRIAGGSNANEKSNPWLIGLFVNGTFTCGGSVIKKDLVSPNYSLKFDVNGSSDDHDIIGLWISAI